MRLLRVEGEVLMLHLLLLHLELILLLLPLPEESLLVRCRSRLSLGRRAMLHRLMCLRIVVVVRVHRLSLLHVLSMLIGLGGRTRHLSERGPLSHSHSLHVLLLLDVSHVLGILSLCWHAWIWRIVRGAHLTLLHLVRGGSITSLIRHRSLLRLRASLELTLLRLC